MSPAPVNDLWIRSPEPHCRSICIIAEDFLPKFLLARSALVPHLCHIGSQMWAIRGKHRQS